MSDDELFDPGREDELIAALREPCQDLAAFGAEPTGEPESDDTEEGEDEAGEQPDDMTDASLSITMREWERRGPDNEPRLQGATLEPSDRALAVRLRQSALLEVTELKSGLEIRSFSHVGRIRLGTVDIRIVPKVPQPTLLNLLRYAFGFRQLRLFDDVSQALEAAGFEDLLVYQLNAEVGELIARGLHRNYEAQHANLSSPRGRIDMSSTGPTRRCGHGATALPVLSSC